MSGYRLFSTLEPDRMNRLIKTAIGQVPADMVIINGSVVNVYTKERMESCNVSICGDRIARVGPKAEHTIGPDTVVIDAASKTVIPGLIDGHTHLAWLFSATEFLKYAMKGGTTTIITETLEPLPVAGDGRRDRFSRIFPGSAHKNTGDGAAHGIDQPCGP